MQLRTPVTALAICLAFGAGMLCAPTAPALAQDGARGGQDEGQEDPGKAAKKDPAKNTAVLEALGGATAFECFASCGYLGALADGFQAGGYNAQYVRVRALGLAGGINVAVKQLKKLEGAGLSANDLQAMNSMRLILVGIVKQAKALAAYAEKKDPAEAKTFRETRTKTWDDLAKAIGLGGSKTLLAPGGAKLGLGK